MRKPAILLVDDDLAFGRSLARSLAEHFDLRHAAGRDEALALLSPLPDAVLLDVRLSDSPEDRQGIALLEALQREHPGLPVLMITGFGDIDTAVECVRLGALDFLEKRGVNAAEIRTRLGQALERARLQTRVVELEHELEVVEPRTLVGDSPAMTRVRDLARSAAADGTVSVLLRGETGTGKELVARAIHAGGPRASGPFIALPLCALPAHTVESELFGHEAGAFTDARHRHVGYVERAHRGVLLLDEIGEIDPALQVKLLRFLEEREFYRLGGSAPVKVDVQVVAATNADLEAMVRDRRFRDDLYYRLKVREIVIPPLRERLDDVPTLARHFLAALRQRGRRVVEIAPDAGRVLSDFDWPGNVRQLRNLLESVVLDVEMQGRTRIEAADLPAEIGRQRNRAVPPPAVAGLRPGTPGFSLDEALARVELQYVDEAMRESGGRVTHAWKLLGANDRFVLSRRIRRLLQTHASLRLEFPELVARFLPQPGREARRKRSDKSDERMKHVFLISRDVAWTGAVTRQLRHVHGIDPSAVHPLSWSDRSVGDPTWVAQTHNLLTDSLESLAAASGEGPLGLRGTLGVIDLEAGAETLSTVDLTAANDWPAVAAMIVLTFPEIYWVFGTSSRLAQFDAADAGAALFNAVHICGIDEGPSSAVRLLAAGYEAMFDAGGLRNRLRVNLGNKDRQQNRGTDSERPDRSRLAASIDEEEAYAYFTAYAAYRLGHRRAHVVTSYALLQALFGEDRIALGSLPRLGALAPVDVVFEDLFLNFPDRPQHLRDLSVLGIRNARLPRLAAVKHRVFVTVGERNRDDRAEHDGFLSDPDHPGVKYPVLHKPLSGLYAVWRQSGLAAVPVANVAAGTTLPSAAEGPKSVDDSSGHSTPGRLYAIATRLLFRCRRLASDVSSVSDALQGALLALDAQELLGARTPTISLEAISLKHEMEVIAECMFHGLEHHKDVDQRHREAESEIDRVSQWFSDRSRIALNAKISVVSQLVLRFREFNQYDEEHAALRQLRRLHRSWKILRFPFGTRWIAGCVLGYFHLLVGSLKWFVVWLLVWVGGLTVVYWIWIAPGTPPYFWSKLTSAATEGMVNFFAAQPPDDLEARVWWLPWIGAAGVIFGFFHLGILISNLYGIVTRK